MKLEDRIKVILENTNLNQSTVVDDPDQDDQDDLDDEIQKANKKIAKDKAKDKANETNITDTSKDKITVKESKNLETDGSEDNKKIKAKQSSTQDAKPVFDKTATPDHQDDAGDNKKIKAKASVKDPMPTVKEHMEALFDGEQLSEEFTTKATAIFESAVATLVEAKIEELEKKYDESLQEATAELEDEINEAVDDITANLTENVDRILNAVVSKWLSSNEVAIESNIRSEMSESFINGMKKVFSEHYVDVPEAKIDIIKSQHSQIQAITQIAEELQSENLSLRESVIAESRSRILRDEASGLTATQADKLMSLSESLSFDDEDSFRSKVDVLKNTYLGKPNDRQINESKLDSKQESKMAKYVEYLTNN